MKIVKNNKTLLLSIVLACAVWTLFPRPARAEWIAPDFGGNAFGAAMRTMQDEIIKAIAAASKQAVVGIVANEVANTISTGSDGNPMFITDWRKTLFKDSDEVTKTQLKNFFSKLGGERNSNYVTADGSGSGIGGMVSNVEKMILDDSVPAVVNLGEYGVSDVSQVFNQNSFRPYTAAFASSGNNIAPGFEMTYLGYAMKEKLEYQNEQIAAIQTQAYGGYAPAVSNGQVIAPGSTIRDLIGKAQGMSFDSLANAKSIGEVVGALVSKVVSNAVHKGIGSAREKVNQNSGNYQTTQTTTSYGSLD